MPKRVLVFVGTRPDAIKMAPVVHALRKSTSLAPVLCATGQHRELLNSVLKFFDLSPQFQLDLMQPNQGLSEITSDGLKSIKHVFDTIRPDFALVQGDTATTFIAALAAFYARVPVGHIEAGLRTGDPDSPFPEEVYRRMVTRMARVHFAPTEQAMDNLRREDVPISSLHRTGNTGIDALLWASSRTESFPHLQRLFQGKKLILMTAHRRENFGGPLREIFHTIREFASSRSDCQFVFPVHPNPNVNQPAREILSELPNVSLIAPVDYNELVYLLRSCSLLLTDSGGLQEEAPTFGKPILVLRDTTERPEAVAAGCARLVGANRKLIRQSLEELLDETSVAYRTMSQAQNPFGDGTAAEKIVQVLESMEWANA